MKTTFTPKNIFIMTFMLFINIGIYKIQAQTPQIWKRYTGEITDPNIPVLPNYSYAGYMRGELEIPEGFNGRVYNVTDPTYGAVPDDENSDQEAIQAAINAAEANGGGIVFFPAGEYLVNTDPNNTSPITINSSNIILKGSGSIPGGTIINMKNYMRLPSGASPWDNAPMFIFNPINTPVVKSTEITKDSKRGDNFIYVDNPVIFLKAKYCRLVMSANTAANEEYLDGKTPRNVWTSIIKNGVALQETHEIESIDIAKKKVYFKDPIIDNINSAHHWKAQTFTLLENCGFEDIHFKANFNESFKHHKNYIHNYGWKAIKMSRVAHSWVRRSRFSNVSNSVKITASSYASSLLNILVDGNSGHALSIVDGGSSRILQGLIWDNTSSGQWHGADMSGKACGSVVWRIDAQKKYGMDLHGSMPRTNLIDLYTTAWVSGAGGHFSNLPNHLTGLTMWNTKRISDNNTTVDLWRDCGNNYCGLAIVNPIIVGYHGNGSTTFVQSHVKYEESNGTKVNIESLYEAQLEHRLGSKPTWIDIALDEWNKLKEDWYATDTLELKPTGDAHVRSGTYGNNNYGKATNLEIRRDGGNYGRKVFLSFDLSAVKNLSSAKLRLTSNNSGASNYDLKYVEDDNWNESTINWNNKPSASFSLGTQSGGTGGMEWDITRQVQSEIKKDGILSLELSAINWGVYSSVFSKEYWKQTSRPTLIIKVADEELISIDDAYVRSGSYADNNYNNTNLEVKNDVVGFERETYLKFNISSFDRKIVSAKLQLVPKLGANPENNVTHDVKFVAHDNWSETNLTWNNKPISSTLLDSKVVQNTGNIVTWDITDQAEIERLGDGYLSVQLSSNNNAYINYNSSESGGYKPKLLLKFANQIIEAPINEISVPKGIETAQTLTNVDLFSLFPNPTTNYVNIQWGEIISSYVVSDLNGVIKKSGTGSNSEEMTIDVQGLDKGIFIIELYNNNTGNRSVSKFVKE
ncbi:CBM96 family carbohydrate-binding protein [Snuella sedimenti]|uniref:DNRLRE domain-containing protein n=1 Tax=Snuella sedimenti TaxID=2798802 RepID=A0A8J7IUE3_9FLAO|nr:DNRLRE domain-containing protein [Snuella sedimenti]MBJ6368255.1 DNRLRE domain-containing protein [Snuella sedimenti]